MPRLTMYAIAPIVHNKQVRQRSKDGFDATLYTMMSAAMPASIAQNSVVMNDGFVSRKLGRLNESVVRPRTSTSGRVRECSAALTRPCSVELMGTLLAD